MPRIGKQICIFYRNRYPFFYKKMEYNKKIDDNNINNSYPEIKEWYKKYKNDFDIIYNTYLLIRNDIKKYIEIKKTFNEKREFAKEHFNDLLTIYKNCQEAAVQKDNMELIKEDMREAIVKILYEVGTACIVKNKTRYENNKSPKEELKKKQSIMKNEMKKLKKKTKEFYDQNNHHFDLQPLVKKIKNSIMIGRKDNEEIIDLLITKAIKNDQFIFQNIRNNDGTGSIWFAQDSLPYGTGDGPIELKIVSFQEYQEFLNGIKMKYEYINQHKNVLDEMQKYIQWLDCHDRKFGLGIIWIFRKKGNKLRKLKLRYLNDGRFCREMKSIGLDPREVDIWISISFLCSMFPEFKRICNMPKTFYVKNVNAIMKLLKNNEDSIRPNQNGINEYHNYCEKRKFAWNNACSIGGRRGKQIQMKNKIGASD